MANQPTVPDPATIDLLFELAKRRIDEQGNELSSITNRLGLVFASSSIVIGLVAGSFPPREEVFLWSLPPLLFALSGLVFVAIFVIAVAAYRYLELGYPPNIRIAWEEELLWSAQEVKRQILANMVEAVEENRRSLAVRRKLAALALYLLPVEAILSVLAVGTSYFG